MAISARVIAPLRYWRGEGPLWMAFWVYGVAVNLAIAAAISIALSGGMAGFGMEVFGTASFGTAQALLALFAAHTVWSVVTVWRCAPNAEDPLFGQIARALTIAWAINVFLLLVFLEADLTALAR